VTAVCAFVDIRAIVVRVLAFAWVVTRVTGVAQAVPVGVLLARTSLRGTVVDVIENAVVVIVPIARVA
jgi:hypothetical protein